MSASEAERTYRRRLLASAMPDGVTTQTLQKSISLLEDEFGSEPNLKYSDLVARLQANLDRAELNVGQLLGRIMTLKKKSPTELGPDPGTNVDQSSSGSGTGKSPALSNMESRLQVFNTLFGHVASDARRRGSLDALRSHLATKADSMGLPAPCHSTLKSWAIGAGDPAIQGANEDLHKVINEAFVWLCGNIGPVDAERVFLRAVKATESLPEAFDCPPRTFL